MEKRYYLCDPEKNISCRKTNCKHNAYALYRNCELTSCIAFAADRTPLTFSIEKEERDEV